MAFQLNFSRKSKKIKQNETNKMKNVKCKNDENQIKRNWNNECANAIKDANQVKTYIRANQQINTK